MERALAVVETTDRAGRLVAEAGQLAAGVGADLLLLSVATDDQFRRKARAVADTGFDVEYDADSAEAGARNFAAAVGRDVLGTDREFEAVGVVGDPVRSILGVARDRECDHLFVPGRRRSPAGKAVFGDVAQQVVLDFDGPVTVMTGED